MLEIKNLTVNYGKISALRDVSFCVNDNEIVSLIGANGAGKSTTLMSISGLVDPDSGSILYNGTEIIDARPSDIVRLGIAHIPEGRHIVPKMTVEENLILGTTAAGKIDKKEIYRRIEEQYEIFPRLKERYRQYGGTLSGGEQQMLAIARGLMLNPSLIMLDEPSLGLAPVIVSEIFAMIRKIRQMGKTVLLIEQNASIALSLSDRAYVLEAGQICMSGTGKELLRDEDVKKAYLGM